MEEKITSIVVNGNEYEINDSELKITKTTKISYTQGMGILFTEPLKASDTSIESNDFYVEIYPSYGAKPTTISVGVLNSAGVYSGSDVYNWSKNTYTNAKGMIAFKPMQMGSYANYINMTYVPFEFNGEIKYGLDTVAAEYSYEKNYNYGKYIYIKACAMEFEAGNLKYYKTNKISASILLFNKETNAYETYDLDEVSLDCTGGPSYRDLQWGQGFSISIPQKYIICGVDVKSFQLSNFIG